MDYIKSNQSVKSVGREAVVRKSYTNSEDGALVHIYRKISGQVEGD